MMFRWMSKQLYIGSWQIHVQCKLWPYLVNMTKYWHDDQKWSECSMIAYDKTWQKKIQIKRLQYCIRLSQHSCFYWYPCNLSVVGYLVRTVTHFSLSTNKLFFFTEISFSRPILLSWRSFLAFSALFNCSVRASIDCAISFTSPTNL